MTESEKRPLKNILKKGDDFRKTLMEHPDLPIVFLAGEDANIGEASLMFCDTVYVHVGEILDCQQEINDEIIYTSRDSFEEDISDNVFNEYPDKSDEWLEEETARIIAEYDPYWKDCIIVTVDN